MSRFNKSNTLNPSNTLNVSNKSTSSGWSTQSRAKKNVKSNVNNASNANNKPRNCKNGADCYGHPERNPAKVCSFVHPPLNQRTAHVQHDFKNKLNYASNKGNQVLLSKCIELGDGDEDKQMQVFVSVIKLITRVDQVSDVLEVLPIPSHIKKSKRKGYTPYNILAFKRECSHEVFTAITNVVHSKGYSIIEKNDAGETALSAVFENKALSKEDMLFRYMTIAQISDFQIINTVHKIFNGVIGNQKNWGNNIDYIRHALCINYELVLELIAEKLIKRTVPADCIEKDKNAPVIAEFIVKCFSGSESSFKNTMTTDNTLKLFFELNEKKVPSGNELLQMLVIRAKKIALESETEYKLLEYECFGFVIGILSSYGPVLGMYERFAIDCLTPTAEYSSIPIETRVKMVIRAVAHANVKMQKIVNALLALPKINGHLTVKINMLIYGKQNKLPVEISQKNANQVATQNQEINKMKFFVNLKNGTIEEIVNENVSKLEYAYDLCNGNGNGDATKDEIIRKFLECLLENANKNIVDKFSIVNDVIAQHIGKNDIQKHFAYFENDFIPDIMDDAPYAQKVWKALTSSK